MRNPRLWAYIAVVLALSLLALVVPHAWATSGLQGGTVPTPTPPGRPRATSIVPTPRPEPTETPDDSGGQPADQTGGQIPRPPTVVPVVSPTPGAATSTAVPRGRLALTVTADRQTIWPGATVHLTATLRNIGTAPLQQVIMINTLAEGLTPGAVAPGSLASWSGLELRVALPILAPGDTWAVPFDATVGRNVTPGTVLQTVAIAIADTGQTAFVQTLLPLPPAELPRTGGRGRFGY